jgi:hypothetical protein
MDEIQASTLYQYGFTAFWVLFTALIAMMFVGAVIEKKQYRQWVTRFWVA